MGKILTGKVVIIRFTGRKREGEGKKTGSVKKLSAWRTVSLSNYKAKRDMSRQVHHSFYVRRRGACNNNWKKAAVRYIT